MEERRDKDSGDIYLEEAILQVREETRKKKPKKRMSITEIEKIRGYISFSATVDQESFLSQRLQLCSDRNARDGGSDCKQVGDGSQELTKFKVGRKKHVFEARFLDLSTKNLKGSTLKHSPAPTKAILFSVVATFSLLLSNCPPGYA